METAYFRFAGSEKEKEAQYFNNAISLLLLTSLIFSAAIIGFRHPIAQWAGFSATIHSYAHIYIFWFGMLFIVDTLVAIPFARLRMQGRPYYFAFVKLTNVLLNVLLNLFFFVLCPRIANGDLLDPLQPIILQIYTSELGLGYAFLSNLIANFFLIPFLFPVIKSWHFSLNKIILARMLVYGYPLLFTGLAGAINEVLDRILLKHWLPAGFYQNLSNEAVVGLYGGVYKLSIFYATGSPGVQICGGAFFLFKC